MLKNRELKEKPDNYLLEKSANPEVFFEARIVVEIRVSDIQVSPVYKCG